MAFGVFSVVLLLAGQGLPLPTVAAPTPWGGFSRRPARGAQHDIVALGSVDRLPGAPKIYWARRSGSEIGATDSLRCPALVGIVESIRRIELPSLIPGNPDVLIGDGTSYSISLHSTLHPPHTSNLDRITIESGSGPLAQWVDQALAALQKCWSRP
jgi:hypothetical protein